MREKSDGRETKFTRMIPSKFIVVNLRKFQIRCSLAGLFLRIGKKKPIFVSTKIEILRCRKLTLGRSLNLRVSTLIAPGPMQANKPIINFNIKHTFVSRGSIKKFLNL